MTTSSASAPAPTVDQRAFRDALGRFATGVAVLTATPDGRREAMIINSLSSVSLEPPLVSFCPARASLTWARMARAEALGVSVLGQGHVDYVSRAKPPGADRFSGLRWVDGRNGAPLLRDALASFECRRVKQHAAGDHWIVVAEVDRLTVGPDLDPLIFFAGSFPTLVRAGRPGPRGSSGTNVGPAQCRSVLPTQSASWDKSL